MLNIVSAFSNAYRPVDYTLAQSDVCVRITFECVWLDLLRIAFFSLLQSALQSHRKTVRAPNHNESSGVGIDTSSASVTRNRNAPKLITSVRVAPINPRCVCVCRSASMLGKTEMRYVPKQSGGLKM